MVPLTVLLSAMIAGVAAQNALEGRPAWHTWLAGASMVLGVAAFIAGFVWIGRSLSS